MQRDMCLTFSDKNFLAKTFSDFSKQSNSDEFSNNFAYTCHSFTNFISLASARSVVFVQEIRLPFSFNRSKQVVCSTKRKLQKTVVNAVVNV